MEIQITTLNVDDADAIIVHLKRSDEEQLVIMIDGGHAHDGQKCLDALAPILEKANLPGPQLIVCTHYDADHIMGLVKVIGRYGGSLKEVWMHRPGAQPLLTTGADQLLHEMKMERLDFVQTSQASFEEQQLQDRKMIIVETYKQMQTLIGTVKDFDNIVIRPPFPGIEFDGWPEIKVLGPELGFYEKCVEKIKDVPAVIDQELTEVVNEVNSGPILHFEQFTTSNAPPCTQLENKRKSPVSAINLISVILEIDIEGNRYLFTGDAGFSSFEALPGYPDCIRDIYWLKVPHHGSHNNNSNELFDIMAPKFAEISGGPRFLNPLVTQCLRQRGVIVRTTPESGDLVFPDPSKS